MNDGNSAVSLQNLSDLCTRCHLEAPQDLNYMFTLLQFELKAKSDFPESLYSKAKRKTIEDMGNRFMRTIQDLDKGNPNEQVDFNPILEKHWSELAEFYSAQVSTVRMLKRKLKAPLPSTTWDPKPTPQVQLPTYLLAQLKELKVSQVCLLSL